MKRARWAVVPLWAALGCGGAAESEPRVVAGSEEPGGGEAQGGGEPLQSVPEIAVAEPTLYACVQGTRLREPDTLDARPVEVFASGTIIESGVGTPGPTSDGTCPFIGRFYFGGAFSIEALELLAQMSWITIREATGETLTLSIIASGFEFADHIGEAVELRFHASMPDFAPTQSWLELRRADGELILWLSHAGRVEELLGASDIERTLGAVDGEDGGQCVTSWERRRVNVTLDGIHASVGYRQQAAVGPWRVTNGGVVIQNGESRCSDAYALSASLAVWSEADTVPYTSGIGGWCDPAVTAEWGSYYEGKSFVCLQSDESSPELSMSCAGGEACLPGSSCREGLCRPTE